MTSLGNHEAGGQDATGGASSLSQLAGAATSAKLNPNRTPDEDNDDLTAHKTHNADQNKDDPTFRAPQTASNHADEYYIDLIPGYQLVCNKSLISKDQRNGILGRGGFGDVYLAKRVSDGTLWAVKSIEGHRISMSDGECQQREFELSSLARIRHPNLIHIEDFYTQVDFSSSQSEHRSKNHSPALNKKRFFMVMELIQGGHTLMKEILSEPLFEANQRDPRFPEHKAHKVFSQLVMGLKALHQAGVAHRDLKPENVMYDRKTQQAIITDFGFAMFFVEGDAAFSDRGTLPYADPCVILADRQRKVGYSAPLADVWSLGVILYAMLTGHLPYPQGAIQDKRRDIFGVSPAKEIFAQMPAAASLVAKMLSFDPAQRITLNGILDNTWFRKDFHQAELLFFHPVHQGQRNEQIRQTLTKHLQIATAAREKKIKDGRSHDLEDQDVEYRKKNLEEFEEKVKHAAAAAAENTELINKLLQDLRNEDVVKEQAIYQQRLGAAQPMSNHIGKFNVRPLGPEEIVAVKDELNKSIKRNFESNPPTKAIMLDFRGLDSIEQLRNVLLGPGGIIQRIFDVTQVAIDEQDVHTKTETRDKVNASRYGKYVQRDPSGKPYVATREQLDEIVMMSLETSAVPDPDKNLHYVLRIRKTAGNVAHMKNFIYHLITYNPNLCRHVKFLS